MSKLEITKRIKAALKKLNKMDHNLHFIFEENEWSCQIKAESKTKTGHFFGSYGHMALFDDYKDKNEAYLTCMQFAELLVAGTKLLDKNAYHNLT